MSGIMEEFRRLWGEMKIWVRAEDSLKQGGDEDIGKIECQRECHHRQWPNWMEIWELILPDSANLPS